MCQPNACLLLCQRPGSGADYHPFIFMPGSYFIILNPLQSYKDVHPRSAVGIPCFDFEHGLGRSSDFCLARKVTAGEENIIQLVLFVRLVPCTRICFGLGSCLDD